MPTYYLAPSPCQTTFFVPGTNTPGNGVQVFTYETGTTTKVSVAKDTAGGSLHTNPIDLDSGGNLPSAASMWIEDGVRIDFQITDEVQIAPDRYDNGYRVILDKDGLCEELSAPTYSEFLIKKPTRREYQDVVHARARRGRFAADLSP